MNLFSAKSLSLRSSRILPWLHFIGAILVFVLISLFTAIHSELGNEISVGESPGFAWISDNIIAELDPLQLFNTVKDPMEKNNLLQEEPEPAAEMEKELLAYLEKVEGKTYRPLFPRNLLNQHLLIFSNCER